MSSKNDADKITKYDKAEKSCGYSGDQRQRTNRFNKNN